MTSIKVYSTPTCPWCQKLKELLNEPRVEYEDLNVAEDAQARERMIAQTGQIGVPQIEIGDRWIVGFDKEALMEALTNA